ncbi:MAG: hypothetical protein LDL12_05040 [Anaerolinea sp.]|nr:hypothetical protein [Anaerolinea sp.]
MGKAKLLVGIIVFVIFVFVGFCVAGQLPEMLDIPTLPAEKQQNYLLIHVDSLDQTTPKILSLWTVSISSTSSITSLKAQPLFPSTATQSAVVLHSFSLDNKGQPTKEFLTLVQSTFRLPINNYILIDNDGLASLRSMWLGTALAPVESNADEILLIEQGCERIRQNQIASDVNQALSQIIPRHFRTDLSFDDAILRWNEITQSGDKLKCEVFAPQR